MKQSRKTFWKEKWNVVLYLVFFAMMLGISIYAMETGNKIGFSQETNKDISDGWEYSYEGGIMGTVTLPATLPKDNSDYLILSRYLPEVNEDMFLIYKARHCFIRVYIDDELIYDNITDVEKKKLWFAIDGSNYIEVPMKTEYSEREITIEAYTTEHYYLYSPGSVYLGERGSFFINLVRSQFTPLISLIVLIITAVILFAIWVMGLMVLKANVPEMLCLGLFTLSVGFWLFTETQLSQMLGYGTMGLGILAYEDLMLMSVPIALFFYYVSVRRRGKILSRIAAIVPLVLFATNNLLHLFHIKSLTETLKITQSVLAVELLVVAIIQVTELRYIHKNSSRLGRRMGKIPMFGIAIIVPLGMMEILKYRFFSTKYPNDGKLITIGVVIYIVSLALDTTLRMAYKNAKIEESGEMKTMFIANMSHEIRTPLNAILGFNEAILQNAHEEKVKDYAYSIHEAGENLRDIINSILDISKIEMGQLQIDEKEYSTISLLDNVSSMFELLAKKKGLDFITDIDSKIPEVLIGDETHLRQILVNILSNAVKYTDAGSVTFRVKLVEMSENSPRCRLLFSVKDTGRGIKEEDREKLFQKFERLDTEHFKHTEGTGLGMSITLATLKAMGSDIHLESTFGEGSNFFFELEQVSINKTEIGDFLERRREIALREFSNIDFRAPRAKILIVDDVEMNIEAVTALLEFTKMDIDKALSGKEALEKIQAVRYDAIFMDHMMPEMDGIETTTRIRDLAEQKQDAYYAMVPIIALTANAMVGMKEMYQGAGMQDFVSKPIEMGAIISILRKWLPNDLIEISSDSSGEELKATETIDEWNLELDCISLEEAKKYNVNQAGLEKNMNSFVKAFSANSKDIEGFFTEGNVEEYVIRVHGLKSTSKIIGAMELSEKAYYLEMAGKEGRLEPKEHEKLISLYTACVASLKEYLGIEEGESSGELIDRQAFLDLVMEIKEAADTFNAMAFMELEEKLDQLAVGEADKESFDTIKNLVSTLAFGEASKYIEEMEK